MFDCIVCCPNFLGEVPFKYHIPHFHILEGLSKFSVYYGIFWEQIFFKKKYAAYIKINKMALKPLTKKYINIAKPKNRVVVPRN